VRVVDQDMLIRQGAVLIHQNIKIREGEGERDGQINAE